MSLEKVIEYIKKRRKKGAKDTQIKKELLEVGWTNSQLEDAFNGLDKDKKQKIKPAPKKGVNLNINKKVLLVSGLVFLLLTGGAFGYFFGGEKLFSPSTPEEELISVFENMVDLNSLSSSTIFNMEYQGVEPHQQFSGNLSLVDRTDKKNKEMEIILKGSGISNEKGGEFEAKMLVVNDKAFVRLDKLPDLSMFLPPSFNMDTILGRNILVTDNLSENFEKMKEGLDEEDISGENLSSIEGQLGEIFNNDVDPQVAKDFLEDLKERLLEKDVVFISETKEDLIDGMEVSRHSIEFNFAPLPEIIKNIIFEYEEYIKPEVVDETIIEIDEFEKALTEAEEEFGEKFYNDFLIVQVWNDKDYIYKVEIVIDQIEEYAEDAEDIEDGKIIINAEFSNFNESLNIVEPEEYIKIEKLMEETFGSVQRETLADTQIRSELSQLRSNAEQYYYGEGDGSYAGFDSSNGWTQISTEIPDCTGLDSYQIKISDDKFIVWSPLCNQGGFFCVDSLMNAGRYQEKVGEGYRCEDFFKNTENESSETNEFYFPGVDKERNSVYDVHIKSDLSQTRSNAEQYYYGEGDGSYAGFDFSEGWEKLSIENPDCTDLDSYQINVSDQEYAAWSPLCSEEAFYCVDAKSNAGVYKEKVGEGYECEEIFD